MSTANTQGAASTDRRQRVLTAAAELFSTTPFEDVSIDDVAELAQVGHGLPFHYFGSKRGLYMAALAYHGAEHTERFNRNTESDPALWLKAELKILLDGASGSPDTFIRVVRNGAGADVGEILKERRNWAAGRVLEHLDPSRDSVMLTAVVSSWVAFANETVAGWLEHGGATTEQLERVMIDVLNALLEAAARTERRATFDPKTFASA